MATTLVVPVCWNCSNITASYKRWWSQSSSWACSTWVHRWKREVCAVYLKGSKFCSLHYGSPILVGQISASTLPWASIIVLCSSWKSIPTFQSYISVPHSSPTFQLPYSSGASTISHHSNYGCTEIYTLSSTLLSYTPTHTHTHIYTRHVSSPWTRWSRSPTGEWMPLSTVWDVGLPSVHISVSLRSQVSLIACSMERWEGLVCLRRLMTYSPLTVLSLMAAVVTLACLHRFFYERGLQSFPPPPPPPPPTTTNQKWALFSNPPTCGPWGQGQGVVTPFSVYL